jgi:hypothetical protein
MTAHDIALLLAVLGTVAAALIALPLLLRL